MHAIYNGFKRAYKLGITKMCLFLKLKKQKKTKKFESFQMTRN